MPKENNENVDDYRLKDDIALKIINFAVANGAQVISPEDVFSDIKEEYIDCSLSEVIREEVAIITKNEPNFFRKMKMYIPAKPEEELFNLYSKRGEIDFKRANHAAKVWMRNISFYFFDCKDREEGLHALNQWKYIWEGRNGYDDGYRRKISPVNTN